ncbi:MAG TPA: hypothetical protein VHN98_03430 [Acidimicrobiales bacterium]|nr:hypothetical protein [Acidimicrobiales bacterium]
MSPTEIAGVMAAVASAVARLHEAGTAHGALEATTIAIDPATGVPALPDARGGTPEADIEALGMVLSALLARGVARDPWRVLARRMNGPGDDTTRWALARLAAAACDPHVDRRPTAAALAADLAGIEGARLPMPRADHDAAGGGVVTKPRRPSGRHALGATGAVLVLAAALVAGSTWGPVASHPDASTAQSPSSPAVGRGPAPDAAPTSTTLRAGGSAASTTTTVATRVWPPSGATMRACPDPGSGATSSVADVDGDGCPDVVVIDATTVSAGAARFVVGSEGDVLVLGDWQCDGRRTLALLRPTSGELYVFDGWAAVGADLTGRLVQRVPGAAAVRPDDQCGRATVTTLGGATVAVRTGAAS